MSPDKSIILITHTKIVDYVNPFVMQDAKIGRLLNLRVKEEKKWLQTRPCANSFFIKTNQK
jgi:hypothetical protein